MQCKVVYFQTAAFLQAHLHVVCIQKGFTGGRLKGGVNPHDCQKMNCPSKRRNAG